MTWVCTCSLILFAISALLRCISATFTCKSAMAIALCWASFVPPVEFSSSGMPIRDKTLFIPMIGFSIMPKISPTGFLFLINSWATGFNNPSLTFFFPFAFASSILVLIASILESISLSIRLFVTARFCNWLTQVSEVSTHGSSPFIATQMSSVVLC